MYRERERFGLRTTSSTTSRGDFWALRASTPIFRQCRIAASRGSRRSAASVTGMSPAPPCTAMAHPISTLSQPQVVFPSKTERDRESWSLVCEFSVGSWKYQYMYKRREWIWCCCKFQKWLIKELIHGNGIVAVNFFHELWFVGFRTKFMCT